jgi:outer membrane protein assembly factor BamD
MTIYLRKPFKKSMRSILISFVFVSFLAACGADDSLIEYVERPVEEIYNEAMDRLEDGDYIYASAQFDEVERQHPYSKWARKAMVMSAYTYYIQNQYDQAILTARRFVSLYPGNEQAPYAYYIIAQSYYEQISDVERDQRNTELAQQALVELIRRYPDSDYARDAVLKLDLTLDHLAGKEMEVGRYYLKSGQYAAAIRRFRNVVENYERTTHVSEALHRLTEIYATLGLLDEAQNAAAILGYNYPNSDWYADSYRILVEKELVPQIEEKSWFSKVWNSVF